MPARHRPGLHDRAAPVGAGRQLGEPVMGATRRTALAVALAAGAALATAPAALAGTIVVNSALDGPVSESGILACESGRDSCTLRDAVAAAEALADDTQITFATALSGATIALNSGVLQFTSPLSIVGPGATALTIDGTANGNGIFATSASSFAISGVTLQNGTAPDTPLGKQGGGAIRQTAGTLTVTNVTFLGNASGGGNDGGAIYAGGDAVTVSGSTFSGNSASGGIESTAGGAVYLDSGTLSVSDSLFLANSGVDGGGAIAADGGAVTIDGSTFNDNTATSGGGAIELSSGTLTVTSSQFGGNSADGAGAISAGVGPVTISGSQVSGNASTSDVGGIDASDSSDSVTLDLSTTLVENNTGAVVGGVYANAGWLTNVIVTGNLATASAYDCQTDPHGGCAGGIRLLGGGVSGSTVEDNSTSAQDTLSAAGDCIAASTVAFGAGNVLGTPCLAPATVGWGQATSTR